MSTDIVAAPTAQFDLSPKNFEQAMQLSEYLASSTMVPKDFVGKPGNCLIAMQWGMEVGLKPLQALQGIAVINGRPSLWGDALLALVRASAVCEYVRESDDGHTATCRAKRKGQPEDVSTFSMDDAKQAGLINKDGPWKQYPKRMRQMRARAFRLRDTFPDVLKGMDVTEAIMDIPKDMGYVDGASPPEHRTIWLPDTLARAKEASAKGATAYGLFWKGLPADEQTRLFKTPEHTQFKNEALDADSARTFDSGATTTPTSAGAKVNGKAVTFATVMADLIAATTLDELGDAADWIGEVTDATQRAELKAKHDELANAMERGA